MSERLGSARLRKISSIAEHGLIPARRLEKLRREHLSSWTENSGMVHGRLLIYDPENSAITRAWVRDGLNAGYESVLAVLAERPRDSDRVLFPDPTDRFPDFTTLGEDKKTIVEERIASSFIVLCDASVSDVPDFHGASQVATAAMTDILIPELTWEQLQQSSAVEILSSFGRVHVITDFIERRIVSGDKRTLEFRVPNYEDLLLQIVNERKRDLWIHGVRLPLLEDIELGRVQ